jgi:alanyl-tRNA synthetase
LPIVEVISKECNQFQNTINNWQKILKDLFEKDNHSKIISWADVFKLYDTCGFPIELTIELANERWFAVDVDGFKKEMEAQQSRSRAWSKDMFKQWIDWWKYLQWIQSTKFVWYDNTSSENMKILKDFEVEWQRILVFDYSPLYWEWWGQMWDSGVVELDNWEILKIKDVKKYEWVFLHFVE